ncbi:MAG TPA: hypothetical protein VF939_03780 [Puia sp.]
MSCCGNKRAAYTQASTGQTPQRSAGQITGQPPARLGHALTPVSIKMWTDLHFVNTGEAPLTVSGAVTGKLYRWAGKGDVQVVDYRDASTLRYQLKVLKRIK